MRSVALQRLLVQLDGSRNHCLLQVATVRIQQLVVLDVGEVSKGGRDVALELDLDSLDFALVDLLLLQVIRLGELDVGLRRLNKEKLGL